MANPHRAQAARFLRLAAGFVDHTMTADAVLQATLCFAIGLEKLLHSILYELNPTYVHKKPEFENTVAIEYKARLTPEAAKEWSAKKLDRDVISLRAAIQRSKAVSRVTLANVNLLHGFAELRDLIAHGTPDDSDIERAKGLVQRYLYPLTRDFAEELSVSPQDLGGGQLGRCADVSAENQESIKDTVNLRLEAHRLQWEERQVPSAERERIARETEEKSRKARRDKFMEKIDCPACGNPALLHTCVDFDVGEGHAYPVGVFIERLECLFCGLLVELPEELDELGLTEWFSESLYDDY